MPDLEEHRQKFEMAESTRLTLEAADSNQHADWIIIAAFYQALHLVDAFFALDGDFHPKGHNSFHDEEGNVNAGRNQSINLHPKLRRIIECYGNLYDASRTARYEPETYKDDPDEVEALLEEDLAAIVTHINELIDQAQA